MLGLLLNSPRAALCGEHPAWLQDTRSKLWSLLGWMLRLQLEEILLRDFALACCWDARARKGLRSGKCLLAQLL